MGRTILIKNCTRCLSSFHRHTKRWKGETERGAMAATYSFLLCVALLSVAQPSLALAESAASQLTVGDKDLDKIDTVMKSVEGTLSKLQARVLSEKAAMKRSTNLLQVEAAKQPKTKSTQAASQVKAKTQAASQVKAKKADTAKQVLVQVDNADLDKIDSVMYRIERNVAKMEKHSSSTVDVNRGAKQPANLVQVNTKTKQPGTNAFAATPERQQMVDAFLWITFCIMLAATIIFAYLARRAPDSADARVFHSLTFFVVAVATLAYYAMATGYGFWNMADPNDPSGERPGFWVRYLDWFVTTPLLLLDLALLAGIPMAMDTVGTVIGLDMLMVASGFLGSMRNGVERWGWFCFGMAAFVPVVNAIIKTFSANAAASATHTPHVAQLFERLSWLTIASWIMYPITWILSEGTHSIPVGVEIVMYGMLDLISKVVFGFVLLTNERGVQDAVVALSITKRSDARNEQAESSAEATTT